MVEAAGGGRRAPTQAFALFERRSGAGGWWLTECSGEAIHNSDGITAVAAIPPDGLDMDALAEWLLGNCDGPSPTRLGFAGLVWSASTSRLIAASGFRSGPSWYVGKSSGTVVMGTLLPQVLDAIGGGLLDLSALVRYADGGLDTTRTIYADVRHVPRGHAATLALGGGPATQGLHIVPWFAASPRRRTAATTPEAEAEVVLQALDEAVTAGIPRTAPVTSLMSGGLDSTVISALAARSLPPGRRVRAYCHIPAPGTPDVTPFTPASDAEWATEVAEHVDRLDLELVDTPLAVSPIAVMRRLIDVSRYPPLVPANEVWLADITSRLDRSPARYTLTGGLGNAMFSYGLNKPLSLAIGGEFAALASWAHHQRTSGSTPRATIGRLVAPLRRRPAVTLLQPYLTAPARAWLNPARYAGSASRALKRRTWLGRSALGGSSPVWPALNPDRWWDDPFTDPEYFGVVAGLPAAAWRRGGTDRSVARRVAAGLLPPSVAFRHGRGGQGADLGARIALHEHEFRGAIDALESTGSSRAIADRARMQIALTHALAGVGSRGETLDHPGLAAHLWARTAARVLEAAETARRHESGGARVRP